uniref:ATP synthase complex subunit 8 n=1 Tax=Neoplocaederus obesus TaxID=2735254 RepID=A0A7D5B8T5_9CUCU|nr:ATP synthase subunit 8 [Neoplocaederus obesus]QKW88541.1 ATP synthase subunit 8 [Neoplocaederus obesus]
MPQMAPLNWLVLFLFFTLVFIIFNTINYYSFLYSIKKESSKKTELKYNWKW